MRPGSFRLSAMTSVSVCSSTSVAQCRAKPIPYKTPSEGAARDDDGTPEVSTHGSTVEK
jgi:hypothetical protein